MIEINHRDPRPLYEQIQDKFRKMIISGALSPDTKLPSVRELASSLAINPNTIQRAYKELESQGFIYSMAGKGNFVASRDEVDPAIKDGLLAKFDELVSDLAGFGITPQD
ncbi:MAG: GntR family transcriptional regulator, partial [Coriobacteriales bacterium]|nr:GntR family transcriptional regulator [Coriobacteriales bacterium]